MAYTHPSVSPEMNQDKTRTQVVQVIHPPQRVLIPSYPKKSPRSAKMRRINEKRQGRRNVYNTRRWRGMKDQAQSGRERTNKEIGKNKERRELLLMLPRGEKAETARGVKVEGP